MTTANLQHPLIYDVAPAPDRRFLAIDAREETDQAVYIRHELSKSSGSG